MFKCNRKPKCYLLSKCKQNREQCIICLETKKIHLECKICYSCKICKDCILPLTNTNLHENCPLCREPKWKQTSRLSSQVIPSDIKLNLDKRIKEIYNKPVFKNVCNCCNKYTYTKFKKMLAMVWFGTLITFISYMIGLLFLFIFVEGTDLQNTSPYIFIFVPIPLGLLVITISGCCCCHRECRRDTGNILCSLGREEH